MTQEAVLSREAVRARTITRAILAVGCLAILGVILVAGLWPFNPRPLNKVQWLAPGNGIEFRPDGIIFAEEPIRVPSSTEGLVSLDIWVQPAIDDTAQILSFDKRHPDEQLRVLQYGSTLLLQQKKNGVDVAGLEVEHSLNPKRDTFFTITADRRQTSVYVNGVLAKTSTNFILTPDDLSGRLVAGAQPFDYDSWAGQLRGLAIYQRLNASQAVAHYQSWTSGNGSVTTGDLEKAVALYRFDEHQGKLIHNAVTAGPNLLIPEAFTVLDKKFLELSRPAAFDWDYVQDVAINIAGFIPLGFCFCAFLDTRRIWQRVSPAWATIIFGAALSLAIEVLQVYLPTRDSSLNDVITNTLGTVVGVVFWRLASRRLLAMIKFS